MRRGNVDFKMGAILMIGGVIGSTLGVALFSFLRDIGQIDLVIQLSYVVFLGIIGALMLTESLRTIIRSRKPGAVRGKLHQHNWLHGLPLKMRFRRSKLYISAILPLGIGAFVGILAAIMGVGGGFIMVPAMIYLLGMPTSAVPDHLCDRQRHIAAVDPDPDSRLPACRPAVVRGGGRRPVRQPRRCPASR
jgi:uncharacterized membrane protein YfcA